MLTMVSAYNPQEGTLQLPLMDSSGGYIVKDIQGLDPVKATLTSSSLAQMDGAQLHNARREPRNIIIKLGLAPDYISNDVASLRSDLYNYFMPKSVVTFGLYRDDVLWGTTDAVVETMDNNMFSSDPEVDISLICYDPDFYSPSLTHSPGTTVNGLTTRAITYGGTSDAGVIFGFTFPAAASEVRLYNTKPDGTIQMMTIAGSFLLNDVLAVNTIPGKKSVILTRGGTPTPSLYYLDRLSTWIELARGVNQFRAYYNGAATAYTLDYTEKYGGF